MDCLLFEGYWAELFTVMSVNKDRDVAGGSNGQRNPGLPQACVAD